MTRADLRLEELHTLEDLRRLRAEWAELWTRVPAATPFQSPAWLLPWMETFSPGRPLVLTVRHEGTLLAVAPFYVGRERDGTRWLRLIGVGNTDYLDLLVRDEYARVVGDLVVHRLHTRADDWDAVDLWPLADDAALLRPLAPSGLSDDVSVHDVCPVLTLPDTADRLDQHVPPRFLAKLRYYRRRLEKLGRITIRTAASDTVDSLFAALTALHEARWRERGEPGVLHDPSVGAFHRAALPALFQQGSVRLLALAIDERVVACTYVLARGPRAWYYLGGFDPALERYSVGTIAVAAAIEAAIAGGARTFDFLRGAEPYKYAWGATNHAVHRRLLTKIDRRARARAILRA